MSVLAFLAGIVIGFMAGGMVCFLLAWRRVRQENNPRRKVEDFISEFNRYYKAIRRESDN